MPVVSTSLKFNAGHHNELLLQFPLWAWQLSGQELTKRWCMDPQEEDGFQGVHRLIATWNPSLSHLPNCSTGAHNTSRVPRIILLCIWSEERDWDEISQFSPKSFTKSPFLPILRSLSFFLAMISTSNKKKPPTPFISRDLIQCLNPLYLCIYTYTHTTSSRKPYRNISMAFLFLELFKTITSQYLDYSPTALLSIVDRYLS